MLDGEQCADCKRINEILSRVGDHWNVRVAISQRMLSRTLKELERDGLLNLTYHRTIPPKWDSLFANQ